MTPTRCAADVLRQARDLRAALEALAEALSRGEPGAVLAHEPALRAALVAGDAPAVSAASPNRTAMARELEGARAALARCRAIGAAHALLTGVTLDALGRAGAFTAGTAPAPHAASVAAT